MSRPTLDAELAALSPEKRKLLEELLQKEGMSLTPERPDYEEPTGPIARRLAEIWEEVLEEEQVGAKDDFFRIGGDSIHCIQMVARARHYGIVLTTQQVFANPVLAELADEVAKDEAAREAAGLGAPGSEEAVEIPFALLEMSEEQITRLQQQAPDLEDAYPLTPVQEGMLFHVLADADPALYRDQGLATIRGSLDTAAFQSAWHRLMERYGALRTSFLWRGVERPIQRVHRDAELNLELLDWSDLESEEAWRRVEERLEEDRVRPMELDRPPLFHLSLVRCPDEEGEPCFRLLWTHHHLAHDAWSLEILVRELLALYAAETDGEALRLAPAPAYRPYVDRCLHHQPETAAEYWRGVYEGREGPTPLPADRGPGKEPRFQQWERSLEAEVYRRLREHSRNDGITLATRIHAAWALWLAAAAEETESVLFGTVVAGRPPDLDLAEGMVGLFINTLPLRVSLDPELPLDFWLTDLQEEVQRLRHYEQTPLGRVREASGLQRETPLFDNVLVVQNVFSGIVQAAGLELAEVRLMGHSNYPLMLRITPGHELRLECLADVSRIPESRARALTDQVAWLLQQLADAEAGQAVGELLDRLRQHLQEAAAAARSEFRRRGSQRFQAARRPSRLAIPTESSPSERNDTP
ncbi:MAG: condensation domain-containing protein [Acidobacteriota bacterium]